MLFYITGDMFSGPGSVFSTLAPIRYLNDGCHRHISRFSLVSIGSHHRHTLVHTIVLISNDATLASPALVPFSD